MSRIKSLWKLIKVIGLGYALILAPIFFDALLNMVAWRIGQYPTIILGFFFIPALVGSLAVFGSDHFILEWDEDEDDPKEDE